MLEDLTPTQRELATLMSEISEQMWRAGWMMGVEHELWSAVMSGAGNGGRLIPTQAQLDELARLSKEIGGWIVFDNEREETFVAMTEWVVRHAKWSPA
jgi:hypothetical protein